MPKYGIASKSSAYWIARQIADDVDASRLVVLRDLLDDFPPEHAIDQGPELPDDPVGLWRDVETGDVFEIGEDRRTGMLIRRDPETLELVESIPAPIFLRDVDQRVVEPASRGCEA